MTTTHADQYQSRMMRTLRYIDQHLADELTLEILSEVAAFSKFHFHRQFSALFGISVHHYIQLGRFKHASYRLAFRMSDPITDIAYDCGYAAPESFSRAFRERFGQTPSNFRKQPRWLDWQDAFQPRQEADHMEQNFCPEQVNVIEVTDTTIALLEHRGDPALIGDTVRQFIAWRKKASLPPKSSATFNIWYDDPEITPPAEFRLGLGAATRKRITTNNEGVVPSVIPGGRCAILRVVGSDKNVRSAAKYLYREWLPASGEELRDFPPYCQRIAIMPDVAEHEAITNIFIPLQ